MKQIETPISQIDNLTFYSGLIDFLGLKFFFQPQKQFFAQYKDIIKILKDNWYRSQNHKEKIIEKTLMEINIAYDSQEEENIEDESIQLKKQVS